MTITLDTRLSDRGQILSRNGVDLFDIEYYFGWKRLWYLRDIKVRQTGTGKDYVSNTFLKSFNTLEAAQYYALSIVANEV